MADRYIFNAANAVPITMAQKLAALDVAGEMTAEVVAQRLGISKKWAYALLRQRNAAEIAQDIASIPTKQRDQVLLTLYKHGSHNIHELAADLHKDGSKIDGHDATKTIWSLANTGHVRFRERQAPRTLYAIRLTEKGKNAARSLANGIAAAAPEPLANPEAQVITDTWNDNLNLGPWPEPDTALEAVEAQANEDLAAAIESYPVLTEHQQDAIDNALLANANLIERPWVTGSLGGWPAIRDVRDRAIKSQKLNAAAKLLEEAGEEEIALSIMTKTEFNALEAEVVALLLVLGELESA